MYQTHHWWLILYFYLMYIVWKETLTEKPTDIRHVEPITVVAYITLRWSVTIARLGGATVARLTPVQKVACSNHVRVTRKVFSQWKWPNCEWGMSSVSFCENIELFGSYVGSLWSGAYDLVENFHLFRMIMFMLSVVTLCINLLLRLGFVAQW